MNLAELQAALLDTATGRITSNPAVVQAVRSDRGVAASERIEAYRGNIRAAHLQALDSAYPVTREVLGPRYWRQLLEHELPACHSASADLDAYGEFVPRLLAEAQFKCDELSGLPYLGELSRLEWTVHRVGFARDDRGFDWERFSLLPNELQAEARLLPANALAMLEHRYPVDDIWRSHREGASPGSPAAGTVTCCCVHRRGRFDVTVSRIEGNDHALFESLSKVRMGDLISGRDDTDVAGAARKIFEWIQRGWIVGFESD